MNNFATANEVSSGTCMRQRYRRQNNPRQRKSLRNRSVINGKAKSACEVCLILAKIVAAPPEARLSQRLGSASSLAGGSCPWHMPILNTLGDALLERDLGGVVYAEKDRGMKGVFHLSDSKNIYSQTTFRRIQRHSICHHLGVSKFLDPSWIESGLLRKWKLFCENGHQQNPHSRCQVISVARHLPPPSPQYFVDTWLECLTTAPTGVDYVTLSYVWGSAKSYTTMKENLCMLQKPGVLNDLAILQRLPRTIKDAIGLCLLLKERYLWIDTLCIVQDDHEMKHSQFNNMASIFANSHLTIVAEDGEDANHGLRGLRGLSQSRTLRQEIYHLTPHLRLMKSGLLDDFSMSTWSERGWTFQEEIFARRKLIFSQQRVSWSCNLETWDEELWYLKTTTSVRQSHLPGIDTHGLNIFFVPFASLSGYLELVRKYNDRKLSYPEDSLFAFSGITTALSRTFPGGFISGLPRMFFDVALLWQPRGFSKRRKKVGNTTVEPYLPSWSWAGWECQVDAGACDAGFNYLKDSKNDPSDVRGSNTGLNFVPLLQWSIQEDTTSPPQKVVCTWQTYLPAYLDALHPLPAGWSRHQHVHNPNSTEKVWDPPIGYQSQNSYFRHSAIPDTDFWFPIPIEHNGRSYGFNARYISCRPQQAWLSTGKTTKPAHFKPGSVHLHEKNGTWSGILFLNLEEDTVISPGTSVELIALSRGFVNPSVKRYKVLEELEIDSKLRSQTLYEFYHVMWIGWDSGIAFRKATGRVIRDAWERQDLKQIAVTLG